MEYSDLPNEYQEKLDANGKLEFIMAASPYILDRNFVESLGGQILRPKNFRSIEPIKDSVYR
ncbi:MAG: hypothetical protein ACLUKN_04775 [Bacilli bacterium]